MLKKYGLFVLIYIFLVAIFPAIASDDNPPSENGISPAGSITASFDRDKAFVGSIASLTLDYSNATKVVLPEDTRIAGLEKLTVIDRKILQSKIIIRVLVDHLGAFTTGPVTVSFSDEKGRPVKFTCGPARLEVMSNLGDKPEEAQLKPIQGIIPASSFLLKYIYWILICLAALLLILLIFRLFRNKKKKDAPILVPAHERARKEIEEIISLNLFENGEIKKFYFRFSEILRRYLEELRGFPAAEFTTQEIALHIKNDTDRKLLFLLQRADMVKFADYIPTAAKKDEEIQSALNYITETASCSESGNISNGISYENGVHHPGRKQQ